MKEFLDQVHYGNTVREYLIALGVIIGGVLLVLVFRKLLLRWFRDLASKTNGTWDDFTVQSIRRFGVPILQWSIVYSGIHLLTLSDKAQRAIEIGTSIIVTYYIVRLITSLIFVLIRSGVHRRGYGDEKLKQMGGLLMIVNGIVWVVAVVFLLGNWGIEVTPIIAGLGIGGIAVALAAQNIVGDVFNYFVIFFDRPFEAGDFIIVDDKLGTIEYVGIKTTQIRSLSGEQLIIGNANLTSSRIHNYKRMARRRIVFGINVQYGTPREIVEKIPGTLRAIVERQKLAQFDRAHFASYNDWSLRFEVVYFVQSPDYNVYMDTQRAINLAIYEEFDRMKVRFAIPTQSVFVTPANDGGLLKPKE